MSVEAFALIFVVGCGALALWVVQRFPSRSPRSFLWILAHLVVANVGTSAALSLTVGLTSTIGAVPALMLVALPPLVYFFVACAWLLLFLQRLVTPVR